MRILILGGGTFVGRALVDAARAHGHAVTTLTRSSAPPGADDGSVEALHADRTSPANLAVLAGREWDAVLDTWSAAPRAVRSAVRMLADVAPWYGYVSSCSVYREPVPAGSDESHPAVEADPGADHTDYAADKRGAELAVLAGYPADRCLLARAGLILGPHEGPGRLPWWLARIADGGQVLAPGPADLGLQFVDARDLADWLVRCAQRGTAGTFNAISPPDHTTMAELLQNCRDVTGGHAEFCWVAPGFVVEQGIEPWSQLPIWLPPGPDHDAVHRIDTADAADAGLRCRPARETVADTWAWMRAGGRSRLPHGRTPPGLDAETERRVLSAAGA